MTPQEAPRGATLGTTFFAFLGSTIIDSHALTISVPEKKAQAIKRALENDLPRERRQATAQGVFSIAGKLWNMTTVWYSPRHEASRRHEIRQMRWTANDERLRSTPVRRTPVWSRRQRYYSSRRACGRRSAFDLSRASRQTRVCGLRGYGTSEKKNTTVECGEISTTTGNMMKKISSRERRSITALP